MKQALPIGIQDFQVIREGNFLYVDKTSAIFRLISEGKYYFLSRPRRFGKSLTLSTIKELYQVNKELFEGLWIENHWNWEQKYPVLHIHFDSMGYKKKGLEKAISDFFIRTAKEHEIELLEKFPSSQFKEIIKKLHDKYNQRVVILIDEYDKPIIDYLDKIEQAQKHREELKDFYSPIKSSDAYIEFLLITGVSKFSKVSIFSELNNLIDLTIHPKFTTLVGYTQEELEEYFVDRINELQITKSVSKETLLEDIKTWYNGYSWDGKNFVYNPFSVLSFFGSGAFQNFWFASGTPTFLIKLFKEQMVYDIGETEVGQIAFESADFEHIDITSLLFQTGYLTIKKVEEFGLYTLDYPNQEVKDSMLQHLIGAFSHGAAVKSTPIVLKVRKAFINNDIELVMKIINSLFKNIPSHIFIKDKEAYYHSVVFLVFQYLGQFIDAEVHTSDGRMDAVVETETHVYILEFKLDESAEIALDQIEKKSYADKFRGIDKEIVGIGINFSSEKKSVEEWKQRLL